MSSLQLIEQVERYLQHEMSVEERQAFEQLRQDNPEIDALVVEHNMFLQQMEKIGKRRLLKHQLQDIHEDLAAKGQLVESLNWSEKALEWWQRSRRTIAVAASIAGLTALAMSGFIAYFTPNQDKRLQALGRKIDHLEKAQLVQSKTLNDVKTKIDPSAEQISGGTSFLIDGKGYLITNSHVVANTNRIYVQNNKGLIYKANLVWQDADLDLAIIKIDDEDFQPVAQIPYSIKKSSTDLAEPVFTLGYPKNEIVYSEGYLSAKSGFEGDTLSVQVAIAANPGNSGGPLLNANGEIIGMLSTKERQTEGVVFAVKSKNIIRAIEKVNKSEETATKLKVPNKNSLKGANRVTQVKKVQDCIYMVKGY